MEILLDILPLEGIIAITFTLGLLIGGAAGGYLLKRGK